MRISPSLTGGGVPGSYSWAGAHWQPAIQRGALQAFAASTRFDSMRRSTTSQTLSGIAAVLRVVVGTVHGRSRLVRQLRKGSLAEPIAFTFTFTRLALAIRRKGIPKMKATSAKIARQENGNIIASVTAKASNIREANICLADGRLLSAFEFRHADPRIQE